MRAPSAADGLAAGVARPPGLDLLLRLREPEAGPFSMDLDGADEVAGREFVLHLRRHLGIAADDRFHHAEVEVEPADLVLECRDARESFLFVHAAILV